MAKYCIECGEELPDKAKFCIECGARQPTTGGQSVSIGRDVGGDVQVAGRDIVEVAHGELRKCKYCKGTGDLVTWEICPDCGGQGYKARPLADRDAERIYDRMLHEYQFNHSSSQKEATIAGLMEDYKHIDPCWKCGGSGTSGYIGSGFVGEPLRTVLDYYTGGASEITVGARKIKKTEVCPHCDGQGVVRV